MYGLHFSCGPIPHVMMLTSALILTTVSHSSQCEALLCSGSCPAQRNTQRHDKLRHSIEQHRASITTNASSCSLLGGICRSAHHLGEEALHFTQKARWLTWLWARRGMEQKRIRGIQGSSESLVAGPQSNHTQASSIKQSCLQVRQPT